MSASAPPDGVIARRFADLDALKGDAKDYLRVCLLFGMRGDDFPAAGEYKKLSALDAVFVRERARDLLPRIEPIRAGEKPLPMGPDETAQEAIPF